MEKKNYDTNEDIEATEVEIKGVCYTVISFFGLVTILIGSIIFFLA